MMTQGQINNNAAFIQGGVVRPATMFPAHVAEIVRCTALAIRRRKEILGPLCRFDPITVDVVEALSRRPGVPNHWSQAWIDVELGCALAAAGELAQAKTTLLRSLIVGGEFDHPLTSTALVELGKLSLETADFAAARGYFQEATFVCVNYPNPSVMEEAFRLGLLAHLLLNQKEPYPGLLPAANWARANNYRHLQASLLLSAAESLLALRDTADATALLGTARSLVGRSDLSISQLGARMNYLTSVAAYQAGNEAAGTQALATALAFQKNASPWTFQIALADSRYLNGDLSDRVGMSLYEGLLRDPGAGDWAWSPLDCLAMLTTPHDAPLEHWFEAVIKHTKQQDLALEITDRARRHRFYNTLPLGGRLTSLPLGAGRPARAAGRKRSDAASESVVPLSALRRARPGSGQAAHRPGGHALGRSGLAGPARAGGPVGAAGRDQRRPGGDPPRNRRPPRTGRHALSAAAHDARRASQPARRAGADVLLRHQPQPLRLPVRARQVRRLAGTVAGPAAKTDRAAAARDRQLRREPRGPPGRPG